MRVRTLAVLVTVLFAQAVFGKDVYLSIGGQVGNFFTDARVFNPSFDKDIVITARYLQGNQNNTGAATKTINVPKRTMLVLDNIVSATLNGGGIGAIRLTSDDDFVATQRIYALVETDKTLGQFVPGLDVTTALTKGAVIQLKSNGNPGTRGTFRTNIGGVNPNDTVANVTFRLYDKLNGVPATVVKTIQPFGVLNPSGLAGFFGGAATSADLSDAWISFESDKPIFIYGSIIDNGSEDPTFVAATADSGSAPVQQIKTVTVAARNFAFSVTGAGSLKQGDQVKFVLTGTGAVHGFALVAPSGATVIDEGSLGSTAIERTVTLSETGTYFFFCTNSGCGTGHTSMTGEITTGSGPSGGY